MRRHSAEGQREAGTLAEGELRCHQRRKRRGRPSPTQSRCVGGETARGRGRDRGVELASRTRGWGLYLLGRSGGKGVPASTGHPLVHGNCVFVPLPPAFFQIFSLALSSLFPLCSHVFALLVAAAGNHETHQTTRGTSARGERERQGLNAQRSRPQGCQRTPLPTLA